MKRFFPLIIFLAALSVTAGVLLSKMSFLARTSMNIFRKKYQYYAFMKVWWQGALYFFIVLMLLLAIQYMVQQKMKVRNSILVQFSCLFLAVIGLYFTYNDFRTDIAHRWAGERLHLGFYLFWIGWASISLFLLANKKQLALKDLNKTDEAAL